MIGKYLAVMLGASSAQIGSGDIATANDGRDSQLSSRHWDESVDFDIARDLPGQATVSTKQTKSSADKSGPQVDWKAEIDGLSAKEDLGPRWSMQLDSSGPWVQLAALGAGRKGRPGLAHVAVDWSF